MNHEMCEEFGRAILDGYFGQSRLDPNSLGKFDGDLDNLSSLVDNWWATYKIWEAQDTLSAAYIERRLTVKGTSEMNLPIQAHVRSADPKERYKEGADWGQATTFSNRIVKTNASIVARLDPKVFMPYDNEARPMDSRKTELGYHDLSALLLNPQVKISDQQYKGRGQIAPEQVYVFMPLSPAIDQAVFQNINILAKLRRNEYPQFYNKIRQIRSEMTRIKLAAEHDMAVAFVMVGKKAGTERPKFKYTLISKTDVSLRDEKKGLVPDNTIKCKLTEARFDDALKGHNLKLGDKQDLSKRLRAAGLFDHEYPPEQFRQKVEAAVSPPVAKTKWSKVEPLPPDVVRGKDLVIEHIGGKTKQNWPTTPGIFDARRNAAINFQSLVLGEMMRYAEVTLAYRQHAGKGVHSFPKFACFDQNNERWIVGTVDDKNVWTAKPQLETFPDHPV